MGKYDEEWLEREFIGYGMDRMPDPQWPGGAKACVSLVVQYYMGAELNIQDGDPVAEWEWLEIPKASGTAEINESTEQMYEFGAREGVPRLLNMFNKHKVPVTWNMFAKAIEKEPYWVKPIVDSGAELSLGGYKYRENLYIDPAEEDALIDKSIDILQNVTGDKTLPKGWMVERRSALSTKLYTLAHKSRGLPLEYSSDSLQDDLPYWVPSPAKDGEGLLMVPYTYDTTDLRFNMRGSGWASPKDWFIYMCDTLDCLLEEGEEGEAKMMTVLLHPHICGRANRAYWLEEFIKYAQSKGVWFARRLDIAQHWKKLYPYDAKKAFGQTPVAPCGQIGQHVDGVI